jgi:hypothetical protein
MSSRKKTSTKPPAAKQAEKEVVKVTEELPAPNILWKIARAVGLLFIAGVASTVSQLNLSPVYGAIPSSLHHQRTMTITAVAALVGHKGLKRYISTDLAQYIGVIAYWTPVIQYFAFQYSGKLGVEYGPLIIESLTYFPFLFLTMYASADLLEAIDHSQSGFPEIVGQMLVPTASYFFVSTWSKSAASALPQFIGTSVYFSRVGWQLLIGSASAFLSRSRIIVFAFPAILHTLWANPHYASEHGFQLANSTVFANENYTILARQESITGYLSVVENSADNAFRLLRCDHSLLGGEWIVTPEAYSKGQHQPESIFAVFVLLEAVRLVQPTLSTPVPAIDESDKAALVIGLGIGTAPNALIAHNLNTTIVEIDPVVHHYATKYFDLSPNHTAVIMDAAIYVEWKGRTTPESYNYIIHDVFTGGAEPVFLFTSQFMESLKTLLRDDGVVAINYAGDLSLGSTKLVLNTIHAVFPACRLYRDTPRPSALKDGEPDFINMVIFCVKNDYGRGKGAINFREPTQKDLLGSIARQNFLMPREENEVQYQFVSEEDGGKIMGAEDVGELEKFHEQGAVSHWKIMRGVVPAGVWEMW